MVNKAEDTRIIIRTDSLPTTLRLVGDVGSVLRAECSWDLDISKSSKVGKISTIRLPHEGMRFGLGASAFGQYPVQAIQRLGESALIEGVPWWTSAEKPGISRREAGEGEMLTPFLVAWDTLDSGWALLDSSMHIPLIEWYEQLLRHPGIGKTGALAIEVVSQIPAEEIIDKYMCRAPLAYNNKLRKGQTIVDPDLIDKYFLRNTVCREVPPDTICTLVMVGVVVEPVFVAARWGDDVLRRGFYATPGVSSHAGVIHHTHAAVILDPYLMPDHLESSSQPIDDAIALTSQELTLGSHHVSLVHIESDTRLSQAIARIGIIENIEIVS